MIATQVCVASRRWDHGQDMVTQLIFENGISPRLYWFRENLVISEVMFHARRLKR